MCHMRMWHEILYPMTVICHVRFYTSFRIRSYIRKCNMKFRTKSYSHMPRDILPYFLYPLGHTATCHVIHAIEYVYTAIFNRRILHEFLMSSECRNNHIWSLNSVWVSRIIFCYIFESRILYGVAESSKAYNLLRMLYQFLYSKARWIGLDYFWTFYTIQSGSD
jgi:hypothetical protein